MIFAIAFQWNWFWIVIITLNLFNVLFTNEVHFVENIKKSESPTMYWLLVTVWCFFTVIAIIPFL